MNSRQRRKQKRSGILSKAKRTQAERLEAIKQQEVKEAS